MTNLKWSLYIIIGCLTPCLLAETLSFTSTKKEMDIVLGKRVEFGEFDITVKKNGEIMAGSFLSIQFEFENEGCLKFYDPKIGDTPIDSFSMFTDANGKLFTSYWNYVPFLGGKIVPCNITGNTTHWERRGVRFTAALMNEDPVAQDVSSDTLWITGRVGNGVMVLLDEDEYAKTNWYWTLVAGQYVPPVRLVVTDQFHNPVQHESFERKITVTVTKNDIVKPLIFGTTTKTVDQETGTVVFDDVFMAASTRLSVVYLNFTSDPPLQSFLPQPAIQIISGEPQNFAFSGLYEAMHLECFSEFVFAVREGKWTDELIVQPQDIGFQPTVISDGLCEEGVEKGMCLVIAPSEPENGEFDARVDGTAFRVKFHIKAGLDYAIGFSFKVQCNSTVSMCPQTMGSVHLLGFGPGKLFCYNNPISDPSVCSYDTTPNPKSGDTFQETMIPVNIRNRIRAALYAHSSDYPPPDLLILRFKYSSPQTNNMSIIHEYTPISASVTEWGIAQTEFIFQMDRKVLSWLSFASISLDYEVIEVPFEMPFCDGVTQHKIETLVYDLCQNFADEAANSAMNLDDSFDDSSQTSSSDGSTNSDGTQPYTGASSASICVGDTSVEPTGFGYPKGLRCCSRDGVCNKRSGLSTRLVFLILLLIIFCVGTGTYLTVIVINKVRGAGSLLTDVDELSRLTQDEFHIRRRVVLVVILFAPAALFFTIFGAIVIFQKPGHIIISVILTASTIVLTFYFFGFHRWYHVFKKGVRPARWANVGYHISAIAVLGSSLYVLLLCGCWIVVGLLLNPIKVATTVAIVGTIIFHVYFTARRQSILMDSVEISFRKRMLNIKGDTEELKKSSQAMKTILTPRICNEDTLEAMKELNLEDRRRRILFRKLQTFTRYRSRYIIVNILTSTFFLFVAVIFVVVAVGLFTQPGLVTQTITSALIILAGIVSNVREEKRDSDDNKVRESVIIAESVPDEEGGRKLLFRPGDPEELRSVRSFRSTPSERSMRTKSEDSKRPLLGSSDDL